MNELQIVTNDFKPAKIDFNYDSIVKQLEEVLEKYNGLVFTDDNVDDCKKTIAELRKGKKALNDFRLDIKKQLTASVTDFENDCKSLTSKIDEVIDPLVEQYDEFEESRKEEKRKKVRYEMEELIKVSGLNEKYASEVVIEPSYLNKSKTMKSIKEDIKEKIGQVKILQDQEDTNLKIISDTIKRVNKENNLNLISENYMDLLEVEEITCVIERIQNDVKRLNEVEPTPTKVEVIVPSEDDEIFLEKYWVEGSEKQLDALEEYLKNNNLKWGIKE